MNIVLKFIGCGVIVASFAGANVALADEQIRVYRVPKDLSQDLPPIASATASSPDVPVNAAPIHWTTPSAWKELKPNSIRIGNLLVPGPGDKKAEVSITSFPGTVGTDLDNVNRWRRELELPPVGEDAITSETVAVGAETGKLYDFSSASARTVVATLSREGAMWFFKIRGDKDVVDGARPAFLEFLKSIHFGEVAAEPTPAPAEPSVVAAPAESSGQSPKWNVPSNWNEAQPGPMVLKSFSVAGNDGKAVIAISVFPGDVGGTFANINRWRRQMGLPPVEEATVSSVMQPIDVTGGKAVLTDMTGTDSKSGKPARLVAAIVPHGDSTWFYKLLGDGPVVAAEKDRFLEFVKTVQYP